MTDSPFDPALPATPDDYPAGPDLQAAAAGDPLAAMVAAAAMTGQTIAEFAAAAASAVAAVQGLVEALPEGFDEGDLFREADLAYDVEPSDAEPGVVDQADESFPILALLVQEVVEADQAATLARLDVSERLAALRAADPELARLERIAAAAAARGRDAQDILGAAFQDRRQGVKVQFAAPDGSTFWATWPKPAVTVQSGRDLKTVMKNAEARIEHLAARKAADGTFGGDLDACRRAAADELVRAGDADVQTSLHLRLHSKTSKPSGPRIGFTADPNGGRS